MTETNFDDKYMVTKDEMIRLAEHKKYKLDKERQASLKSGSWDPASGGRSYGFGEFLTFSAPMLWRGSCGVKFMTIMMFISLLISRLAQVVHPLVLKQVIKNVSCDPTVTILEDGCPEASQTYILVVIYALVKFGAEFLNYIREVPFAYMSANAEKNIAAMVYAHV